MALVMSQYVIKDKDKWYAAFQIQFPGASFMN